MTYTATLKLQTEKSLFFVRRRKEKDKFCSMVSINLDSDYGYVVAVAVSFWILQTLFTIPIGILRNRTGIKPPTLYPTDKQVQQLKLQPDLLDTYMRAQVTLIDRSIDLI